MSISAICEQQIEVLAADIAAYYAKLGPVSEAHFWGIVMALQWLHGNTDLDLHEMLDEDVQGRIGI